MYSVTKSLTESKMGARIFGTTISKINKRRRPLSKVHHCLLPRNSCAVNNNRIVFGRFSSSSSVLSVDSIICFVFFVETVLSSLLYI